MCDAAWCAPCTWAPLRWAVPTKGGIRPFLSSLQANFWFSSQTFWSTRQSNRLLMTSLIVYFALYECTYWLINWMIDWLIDYSWWQFLLHHAKLGAQSRNLGYNCTPYSNLEPPPPLARISWFQSSEFSSWTHLQNNNDVLYTALYSQNEWLQLQLTQSEFLLIFLTNHRYTELPEYNRQLLVLQDSWAIAKKTARCAQYTGALKSFQSPHYAPGYFSRNL